MKRTTTREIFIEIETIRITKNRSVRRKSSFQTQKDVPHRADSCEKSAPEHPFGESFRRLT